MATIVFAWTEARFWKSKARVIERCNSALFSMLSSKARRAGAEVADLGVAEAVEVALVDELGEGGEAEAVAVGGGFVVGLHHRPGDRREHAVPPLPLMQTPGP